MPISMHKFLFTVLIHGPSIIKESLLPMGELFEETQEEKNKDIRYFREHHTRKNSCVKTNEDLFLRMIHSSDPFLSSFKDIKEKYKTRLDHDVIKLINFEEEKREIEEQEKYSDEKE